MSSSTFDVIGVGNAIVDIIGKCDDAFLEQHGAPKGHMRLIEADEVKSLYEAMGSTTQMSGGSAANTIAGIASFGGQTAYIGKVADDQFGTVFAHDLKAIGVNYATTPKAGATPTAQCLVLVTPDGERTMNTFLGVSPELTDADLDTGSIQNAKVVYLEGYLFDRPEAKAAFYKAAKLANQAGVQVALTLSDAFCVDRHRGDFMDLINGHVDILFANEAELMSLVETDDFNAAVDKVGQNVKLLAATRSEQGSVLIQTGSNPINIPPHKVDQVVDTTGAGDLYAAGLLFGLSRDMPLDQCGALGSLAAAEVISHVGARPATSLKALATSAGILT